MKVIHSYEKKNLKKLRRNDEADCTKCAFAEKTPDIEGGYVYLCHAALYDIETLSCFVPKPENQNNGLLEYIDKVCKEKPPAVAYIDDRAICFDGHPETLLKKIQNFQPWYKMPTLTPPNEWVSVDERLPEPNSGAYWVAKKKRNGEWQMKLALFCDYGYAMPVDGKTDVTWRDWDFTKIVNVTHWMPLPEPPDKDNNVLAKTPNEPLPVLVNDEPDREYIDYICPRCKDIISQRRRGQRMETVYQCKYHDNCGQCVDWNNSQPDRRPPEEKEAQL